MTANWPDYTLIPVRTRRRSWTPFLLGLALLALGVAVGVVL